jgi:hypothetical protein
VCRSETAKSPGLGGLKLALHQNLDIALAGNFYNNYKLARDSAGPQLSLLVPPESKPVNFKSIAPVTLFMPLNNIEL